jgi:hypothetical protein
LGGVAAQDLVRQFVKRSVMPAMSARPSVASDTLPAARSMVTASSAGFEANAFTTQRAIHSTPTAPTELFKSLLIHQKNVVIESHGRRPVFVKPGLM